MTMSLVRLINVLHKMKLLSPAGLFRLLTAIYNSGINLMALLRIAAKTYGNKTAIADDHETIDYSQLWEQSEKLALLLQEKYQLARGKRVGLFCKNHAALVRSIFAVSGLGADLYLLNAEMSQSQFNALVERYDFDLLIYDFELNAMITQSNYRKGKIVSNHDQQTAISNVLHTRVRRNRKLPRVSMGRIIILTGGTTGNPKAAAHKPSLFNFLNPFNTLLSRLHLASYHTAYIATPIYHGYGVAQLLVFIALGKKIVIHNGFDVEKACTIIREHHVEVVTVVPLMLHKMLQHNTRDLQSLKVVASGGAPLNPKLVTETFNKLGAVLYNLYGTSEAGLNMVATPQDLQYSAQTIGRQVSGVHIKIVDEQLKEMKIGQIGQIYIQNRWSMRNRSDRWIETGDMGYQDPQGYYYLCGRADDMVVSAGENVYPIEVEQVLLQHPLVEDIAVIGVQDEMFGQRLRAFVLLKQNADITTDELFTWLRSRVARYQIPKDIIIVDHMPYTSVGKLDKKRLKEYKV